MIEQKDGQFDGCSDLFVTLQGGDGVGQTKESCAAERIRRIYGASLLQ